jgi:5-methyltetrahydrofolate--homocysteine methyltransferase
MERPHQSAALSAALSASAGAGSPDRRPLLGDGGIGSQLLTSGFDDERDFLGQAGRVEVLGHTRQEQVQAVHESYFDAGCQWATTNTFGAWPREWAERGAEVDAEVLIARNAAAAIEAALAWRTDGDELFVVGCLGPGEVRGDAADARRAESARVAQALASAGVDALLCETALDLEEARAQLAGFAEGDGDLRRWLSLWVNGDGRPADGRSFDEWSAMANDAGVELLAINCVEALPVAVGAARALREVWSGSLGLWPNAGAPEGEAPNLRWSLEPGAFAETLKSAADELQLAAVAGCCGTGPAHLRRLAQALGRVPEDPPEPDDEDDEDEA